MLNDKLLNLFFEHRKALNSLIPNYAFGFYLLGVEVYKQS